MFFRNWKLFGSSVVRSFGENNIRMSVSQPVENLTAYEYSMFLAPNLLE